MTPSFAYEDSSDSIEPTWVIQENLPILRSLIRSAVSFLLYEVTDSQVPQITGWASLGAMSLPTALREQDLGKKIQAVNIKFRLTFQEVWIRSEEGKIGQKRARG